MTDERESRRAASSETETSDAGFAERPATVEDPSDPDAFPAGPPTSEYTSEPIAPGDQDARNDSG